jgi:DNA (cytosine-5)-methyltransferase 1
MNEQEVFKMKFIKGELFCGPGGLSLGAKMAKLTTDSGEVFEVVHGWANDNHPATCETFRRNILNENDDPNSVICKDVRKLDIKSLPKINAFAFGFPCNDFSTVGESRGLEGEYGPLYTYGVKVLQHHQPDWFIAENVSGLQSSNEGSAFLQILKDLKDAGYVITPHLYKFEEYGVPQARHRVIIVGIRKDLNVNFRIPAPTTPGKEQWKSSKEALENPPISASAENNERTAHKEKVIKMLEYIKPGQNAWSKDIPEELRLNVKGARLSNIYKRLDPDLPAYTVTGSGGGGTHMYHYSELRALTNRERARLQTFPDWFVFKGKKEEARRQVGMAVPPDGAKVIVEAILKSFAGIDYPCIEPKWKDLISIQEAHEKKKKSAKIIEDKDGQLVFNKLN